MEINRTFGPIDIAISGLRAQGKNMEAISSNVANAQTTDAGNGEPYRRIEAKFKSEGEGISGVTIEDMEQDMSDFQMILDAGNPNADERGYIKTSNVSVPMEMMNLTIATRAYQANAAILKRYQKMVDTTLELLR